MALLAMRHGIGAFWRTLPVGQYDYPEFLYFGGHRRAQTAEQLDKLLPKLLGNASEVVHLDFHTGLGRWANCDLLLGERERPETQPGGASIFAARRSRKPSLPTAPT